MIPRLHLVTDDEVLHAKEFPDRARAALQAGGAEVALHLRGAHASGERLLALADALLPAAREAGALLLVNDRVDVALCAGAHGVHLGGRSLPVAVARGLVPAGALVGLSVHGAAPLTELRRQGTLPDFVVVGTIHPTPSHPERTGAGVERIQEVVAAAGALPVVAIGGITAARMGEVMTAGAAGAAVIRAAWSSGDPGAAVGALLESIHAALRRDPAS